MSASFTPGPWRWNASNGDPTVYGGPKTGPVARASARYMNRAERDANARLIAAAPEMLELLWKVRARLGRAGANLDSAHPLRELWVACNASIAKALGYELAEGAREQEG